jgi:SAM-dependent methyltransferase
MEMSTPRWPIRDEEASLADDRAYWESVHRDDDYESVFGVGEDEAVVDAVVAEAIAGGARDVLIAGCGSRVELQRELLDRAREVSVTATDYAGVVAIARARCAHAHLRYLALEDRPELLEEFDVVVSVNVLVKSSDEANRALVKEWARALKPGGRLVMLVPILFCGLDLALLTGRRDLWECLDLERSSWIERAQGVRQIEYSPLRIRRVLREAGLRLSDLRLIFLESATSRAQTRSGYELDDEDLLIYEQLVVARRD